MTEQTGNTLTPVGELAQTLLQFDYFHVQNVIDKRVIFNAFQEAFQREGVSLEAFLQKKDDGHYFFWSDSEPPKVLPAYAVLWTAAAHKPHDCPILVYGESAFIKENGTPIFDYERIIGNLVSRKQKDTPIDASAQPAMISYMQQAAYLLTCCTFRDIYYTDWKDCTDEVKRAQYVIAPLMELLKNGYGIPFVVGGRNTVRVEVRIPVWDVEVVPEIIECPEAPWLEVSVIQGGAFVPEKVWRYPEKISVEDILSEPNMEVRRVMLERLGNEKFIEQAKLTLLDEKDGLKLYAIRLGWSMHFNLVQCVCPSTLRVYYLRVPPEITDANTAIAWTFLETGQSYQPERET